MTNLKIVQWQAGFVAFFVSVYLTHRSLEPKPGRCGTTLQISLEHWGHRESEKSARIPRITWLWHFFHIGIIPLLLKYSNQACKVNQLFDPCTHTYPGPKKESQLACQLEQLEVVYRYSENRARIPRITELSLFHIQNTPHLSPKIWHAQWINQPFLSRHWHTMLAQESETLCVPVQKA